MSKNKYLMIFAGMIMQVSIGSIYAYSKWIDPLYNELNWEANVTKNAFSFAICFLGLTAAFMGKFVQKVGPTKAGILGALFLTIGLIGSSIAVANNSLPLFFLTFGVLQGIGLGFGYVVPIYTVVKWFPDRSGLASGLIIMSFALGSLLASFLIGPIYKTFGLSNSFLFLGVIYGVCMLLSSLYLSNPSTDIQDRQTSKGLSIKETLTDKRFIALWFILFFNVCGGIAIISKASILGKDLVGMTESQATIFVASIGLFNGLGRFFWSSISDRIGCWLTFIVVLSINAICFALIPNASSALVFQLLTFIIIAGYGAGFSIMPLFVKSIYGSENYGQVFGFILTSWSVAAFVGPIFLNLTPKITIFYLFSLLTTIALVVGFWLKKWI